MLYRKLYTCCFIGHRKNKLEDLKIKKLKIIIENLILEQNFLYFLFGSKSKFNDICLNIMLELKQKFPYIKLIYIRAEYQFINDTYKKYLLNYYDYTFFPSKLKNSNKFIYIKRNYLMIDKSNICIFHFDTNKRNGGTKLAYNYAIKNNKNIINI